MGQPYGLTPNDLLLLIGENAGIGLSSLYPNIYTSSTFVSKRKSVARNSFCSSDAMLKVPLFKVIDIDNPKNVKGIKQWMLNALSVVLGFV